MILISKQPRCNVLQTETAVFVLKTGHGKIWNVIRQANTTLSVTYKRTNLKLLCEIQATLGQTDRGFQR